MIKGVVVTPLKVIDAVGGVVLQAMKASDRGYDGFGEVYFSTIEKAAIKGWKRHKKMKLNLVVPVGVVRFVIFDDRKDSLTMGNYSEIILSRENYSRLTVPPMVWLGFQGTEDGTSILLNIANISHDPAEIDHMRLDEIKFDWEIK